MADERSSAVAVSGCDVPVPSRRLDGVVDGLRDDPAILNDERVSPVADASVIGFGRPFRNAIRPATSRLV